MRSFRLALIPLAVLTLAQPSFAAQTPETPASPAAPDTTAKKCDAHGVKKTICARCKPKLAAAFKAKGDWCAEHERPESQCAICKPALKKEGVRP